MTQCGHVPNDPNALKTICLKCGASVSLDESTRLWKANSEMQGYCFLFSETGTEGGHWAMQEDGFKSSDGIHESYDGLRYLKNGDDFAIYAEDGSVLWHGIIKQDTTTGLRPHSIFRKGKWRVDKSWQQQVVGGMWVHWVQAGMDPEEWGRLFEGNKRCLLKREEK